MVNYAEAFTTYVASCFKDETPVMLRTALDIINPVIVQESSRLTDLEGLKNSWKSRLRYIYDKTPKTSQKPKIDLNVNEGVWVQLYVDISKYEIENYNKLSEVDRQRITARLYREENENFGRNLLDHSSSSSAAVQRPQEKNNEVSKKRKMNEDSDERVEPENDEVHEFNSSLSEETEKTDSTYKTESSTHYAENFKSKKYVLTLHELKSYEEESVVHTFDEDSTLEERLEISSINLNTVLQEKIKLKAVVLKDEEYSKIRSWRRSIANDETYFPPHATTIDELNLNNLLCTINDTVLKNYNDKSEIGFIANDLSPIFRYLFSSKDLIRHKWEKSSFKISNNTNKKIRLDFIFYANDDEEIGCGEVKICNDNPGLLDNDRARIAETLKRQLHVRIMKCKDPKEMMTFGMLFNNHDIELYIMTFDNTVEQPYQLYKIRTLTTPTSLKTYTNMEETLEYLKSFKDAMISSLSNDEDILKPLIYSQYVSFFKPTLSLRKD